MVIGNYCSNPKCSHGFATLNGKLMTECEFWIKTTPKEKGLNK
jgi:hypothetical protein